MPLCHQRKRRTKIAEYKDIQIHLIYRRRGRRLYKKNLGEYDIEIVSLCKDAMTKAKSMELGKDSCK